MLCGYCEGAAVWNEDTLRWEHVDDGARAKATPGDYVSGRHNRAGTEVLAADLVEGTP